MPTSGKIALNLKKTYIPVLEKLKELNKKVEANQLSKLLGIPYEKLMSGAVYNLQEKGLALFTEEDITSFELTKEGKKYLKLGLPGRQLFNLLTDNDRKEIDLDGFFQEVEKKLGFTKKIFFIGISTMKKQKWVVSSKATGKESIFIYDPVPGKMLEEEVLELYKSKKTKTLQLSDIPKKLQKSVNDLSKRKILKREKYTIRNVQLSPKGKETSLDEITIIEEEMQLITSDMIKSGSWKDSLKTLKAYEIGIEGPRIQVGKYHPITIIKNQIREIFLSMGFQEIRGPIVETAFYNFDCLFQPQGHPAREMHDTFYLKHPAKGKLPNKKFVDRIKNIHENGGDTGSTGWKYEWSPDIAKQTLLRTHTTATTLRNLIQYEKNKDNLPIKLFCIDRVFRNENLDRTHLAEFEQIDGIVIGKNVTLRDLIGQLTEFYKKMGFKKIITRPGFFPYTEPSMEVSVYSEELEEWIEMGGSGIFRPEVSSAWGIKEPVRVLAWGLGLERLAMLKLKREDIRDLYQSPIDFLREVQY